MRRTCVLSLFGAAGGSVAINYTFLYQADCTVVFTALPINGIIKHLFCVRGSVRWPFPCNMSVYMRHTEGREEGLPVVERGGVGKAACPTNSKDKSVTKPKPGPGPLSYLGQSSPSSGVISVSLCTTTLVTDMSGCCSLASFMA